MIKAKKGDKVKVAYTGMFEDGKVFDSCTDRDPLKFKIGAGELIAGFDRAVVGMAVGEKKTVKMSPDQAYGAYDESLVVTKDRKSVPADWNLAVGSEVSYTGPEGDLIEGRIKSVSDSQVVVDTNHELAGKTLTFDIILVKIG